MTRFLLTAALCLIATSAQAFPATVSSVHDGDTLTAQTSQGRIHVRLEGIDAPEFAWRGKWGDQPYAYESHAALETLIEGQTVDLECNGQESYNREVCSVYLNGVNVNRAMVLAGDAWSATQFEPAVHRDPLMPALEADARLHKRGLWQEPVDTAPWEWRHEGLGR